jgi:hypothetical protein
MLAKQSIDKTSKAVTSQRRRNTVETDPLQREIRDAIREKYGNGLDETL